MEKGLDVHWKRTLGMFTTNFERAFKNHEAGIRLKFEYYDEAKTDVRELARSLAFNDEVYAVIGGLYSSNAAILAAELTIVGKTFFTLATAEQLVRAYASTGYLWAMTETDITQCEVLLSKVINYEGKSVALLVKENDGYGQTFIEVLHDIRLTRVLTQRILTMSAETLRYQVVAIKLVLVVTIGMHTSYLGKDVVSYYRSIRSHGNTTISFNQSGNIVQTVFLNIGLCLEHILQNHLNTCQWCIATSTSMPITTTIWL
jgi:hypothetical protein